MSKILKIFLFGVTALAQANPPPLVFNCGDRLEDVCTNMCWGAYCTQPAFGATLSYDNYAGEGGRGPTANRRRESAGCLPRPNRCSTLGGNPRAGENCDEYPFASTSDADMTGQVSRCVISNHNSRQGNMIMQYIGNNCAGQVPCSLVITFGNPAAANVNYCQAYNDRAGQCVNNLDPPIFKNGMRDADFSGARIASVNEEEPDAPALFLLASGMEVVMPAQTPLNSTAMHPKARDPVIRAAVEAEEDGDESLIEWDFEPDMVVARLS